jgi:hypothetical protein
MRKVLESFQFIFGGKTKEFCRAFVKKITHAVACTMLGGTEVNPERAGCVTAKLTLEGFSVSSVHCEK